MYVSSMYLEFSMKDEANTKQNKKTQTPNYIYIHTYIHTNKLMQVHIHTHILRHVLVCLLRSDLFFCCMKNIFT